MLEGGCEKPPKVFGVYEFWDDAGTRIYVGKAVDLRNRLGQYRNPPRGKRGVKMRRIVAAAKRLTWTICISELDALEKELQLIQSHRPKFNTSGAFSFMYPYLGVNILNAKGDIEICFTTTLQQTRPFALWGAFRSRQLTLAAFEGLSELLGYLCHRTKRKAADRKTDLPYSIYAQYRQMSLQNLADLRAFFGGKREFLAELALSLLEKPQARRDAKLIQDWLMTLEQFFDEEIAPLLRASASQNVSLPIQQTERDFLFLRERAAKSEAGEMA